MQTFAAQACNVTLPSEQVARLKRLSQSAQATLYMTMLAAFGVLVSRHSGQDDIVVGSPIANRQDAQLETLIGLFVNSLVMRMRVDRNMSFLELLSQLRQTALEAYRYQDVPFEKVVEVLSPQRSLNTTPIYQVMFALQNAPWRPQQMKELDVVRLEGEELQVRLDLEVHVWEHEGNIGLLWLYNRDLFERWRMEQMAHQYVRVLEAVLANPNQAIKCVDLLGPEGRRQILERWNLTGLQVPLATLACLFEEQAGMTPEAVAVSFERIALSYRELNERSNRLARMLVESGVGSEDVVALAVPRSLEMIVALLAILKAGAAYLPLDFACPPQRLASMLKDAQASCLLATQETVVHLPDGIPHVITLDAAETMNALMRYEASNLGDHDRKRPLTPQNAAYVIYTSGSTGVPKGVLVTHQSVVQLLAALKPSLLLGQGDVGTLFHSLAADISVWEIWGPLLSGGRLVVVPFLVSRSPAEFWTFLLREGVTVLSQTPSALYPLMQVDKDDPEPGQTLPLRAIVIGGEALESCRLRDWYQRYSIRELVSFNLYGPTEVTVWASIHTVGEQDIAKGAANVVSIGRPLANYAMYVLDHDMEALPVGVTGEIYISGGGLARGYLNQPGLTAEKFLPHPFADQQGLRLYRTGDLGRWLPDGRIEFLGRVDEQLKLRGYRIEPGEIEAVLLRQAGVRHAVVTLREDETGNKCLVAYTVPEGEGPSMHDLKDSVRAVLPEYMVPSVIVTIEKLPMTPSGKLDRKALPKPEGMVTREAKAVRSHPRDGTETYLKHIWEDILGLTDLDIRDNFFDIGGHSMSAVVVTIQAGAEALRPKAFGGTHL